MNLLDLTKCPQKWEGGTHLRKIPKCSRFFQSFPKFYWFHNSTELLYSQLVTHEILHFYVIKSFIFSKNNCFYHKTYKLLSPDEPAPGCTLVPFMDIMHLFCDSKHQQMFFSQKLCKASTNLWVSCPQSNSICITSPIRS